MRFKTSSRLPVLIAVASLLLSSLVLVANVFGQETTGGLQGTIKDASGAVVAKASVVSDRAPRWEARRAWKPTAAATTALPTCHRARTR